MAKPSRGSSFRLPIGAAGPGEGNVQVRGFCVAGLALVLLAAAVDLAAYVVGRPSWPPLADLVFILVRAPRSLQAVVSQGSASGWCWLVWVAAVLLLVRLAGPHMAEAAALMSRNLSVRDRFPLSGKLARSAATPLACVFFAIPIGAFCLWTALSLRSDSIPLRVVRAIAIGFACQIACMLMGAALACSHAEGKAGAAAIRRVFSLMQRQKGQFMRAAVYTLPRWFGAGLVTWCMVAATIGIPFLIGVYLIPWWVGFLSFPVSSPWGRVGRVAVLAVAGIVLVSFWAGLAKMTRDRMTRIVSVLGLVATAWALLVLPLLGTRSYDPAWVSTALQQVAGQATSQGEWPVSVCLSLVGVIVGLVTLQLVGHWMFLYPLAAGVASFFVLRRDAEDREFHSTTGHTQGEASSLFSTRGALMFASGESSALDTLSPPRGWLALAWVGLRPKALLLTWVAGSMLVALAATGSWVGPTYRAVLAALLTLVVFLPILCREISGSLAPEARKERLKRASLLPLVVAGTLSLFALDRCLAIVALALGGSLGLIPGIGPVVWGAVYPLMFMGGAGLVAGSLIRWVPGCIILPAVAATDIGPSGRSFDLLRQTEHYATATPWSFLGAMLAGLPLALLPALLGTGVLAYAGHAWAQAHGRTGAWSFDSLFGDILRGELPAWGLAGAGVIAGLGVLGLAVAIANAYFIVRESTGERPFQIGDAVILGRHREVGGEANWNPAMDRFVGGRARIIAFVGQDPSGCDTVRVDLDHGTFVWRVMDLTHP